MGYLANRFSRRFVIAGACALVVAGTLGLSGCGDEAPAGSQAGGAEGAQQAEEAEQAQSEYVVTIDGCTVTTDYEGAPAIIVDFTFTNNSEEDTSFAVACNQKAFQNGVQLESAVVTEDLGNGYMAEIKPGGTTEAHLAYVLTDDSDVSVEVEELISFDDTKLAEKTFSVA